MLEKLIQKRIFHISILFAFSIFLYQILDWPNGIWIPVTMLVITGPFRQGLSIYKAKHRILGTIAGLFLAVVMSVIIRYTPSLLVIYSVILVFIFAFTIINPEHYKYSIMLTTVLISVSYSYMNPIIFSSINIFANRFICVFTGIFIFLFAEIFLFRRYYEDSTSLLESEKADQFIQEIINEFTEYYQKEKPDIEVLNQYCTKVIQKIDSLDAHKNSFLKSYTNQDKSIKLINLYLSELDEILTVFSQLGAAAINENIKKSSKLLDNLNIYLQRTSNDCPQLT